MMIFDRNNDKPVVALLGAGSMGTAIVRRFVTGTDLLIDGGVIASIRAGEYQLG